MAANRSKSNSINVLLKSINNWNNVDSSYRSMGVGEKLLLAVDVYLVPETEETGLKFLGHVEWRDSAYVFIKTEENVEEHRAVGPRREDIDNPYGYGNHE